MATSGSFSGNSVTYGCYIFVNWQLASQEIANNRSLINFQVYFHFQGSDTQLDSGSLWSNVGTHWSNGGRVYNYSGNLSTRNMALASGSFWVNHYADGVGVLQFGLGITTQFSPTRSEGVSGIWDLPTIPRASQPSIATYPYSTPNQNIGSAFYIHMNRASASFTHTVTLTFGGFSKVLGTGVGANYYWDTTVDDDDLYAEMVAQNTKSGTITVDTYQGGTHLGTKTTAINLTIPAGTANPTFSTVTYEDGNSATVAITGDDQYLIQGYSTLSALIASGDKALAIKSATMVKYNFAISSINQDLTYTTSAIDQDLGVLGVNTDTNLVVKAIDSRNNFTSVTKLIKVLPYIAPQITATAIRDNNFETSTAVHIEGVISRLTIASTDKNAVNTATGVAYRVKKTTDVSWGSWTDRTSSTTAGSVSTTDFDINLDRNYAWNMQVRLTDALTTSTVDLLIPVGIPIFRIGVDGKIYNNEKTVYACPFKVGDILISTSSANPDATFEGTTWTAWGAGRVPVGFNSGDASFDAVEETGGAKTHTLSTAEIPSHNHNVRTADNGYTIGVSSSYASGGTEAMRRTATADMAVTQSAGGGGSHNNLQPYIVAYMWKRTA